MKTNQQQYTKTSLVAHFLQGCKRFFILSILMSFLNTLMEMLIPQVIRRFVDSVIGDDPLNLPAFAEAWLARLAAPASSQVYLREHMYLVAILIGIQRCWSPSLFTARISPTWSQRKNCTRISEKNCLLTFKNFLLPGI